MHFLTPGALSEARCQVTLFLLDLPQLEVTAWCLWDVETVLPGPHPGWDAVQLQRLGLILCES